jgi:hypothetical protein
MFVYITNKFRYDHSTTKFFETHTWRLTTNPRVIPQRFIDQLFATPRLETIRFKSSRSVYPDATTSYIDRVPNLASMWDIHQAQGILIRTYSNKSRDWLVLLRVRVDGSWWLYANMNGGRVAIGRIEAALRLMGEKTAEWDQPGRDLCLSEEAWKIVRGREAQRLGSVCFEGRDIMELALSC